MSVAEQFLSAARQILLATENIKHLDDKVQRLADQVSAIDHRIIRLEVLTEANPRSPRKPTGKSRPS